MHQNSFGMKWSALTVTALLCAIFLFAFTSNKKPTPLSITEFKKKNIISCSPDRFELTKFLENVDITPMPGAGNYHWKIATGNDSAQFVCRWRLCHLYKKGIFVYGGKEIVVKGKLFYSFLVYTHAFIKLANSQVNMRRHMYHMR